MWIKTDKGKPSASLTFATMAFAVVLIHKLLSIFVNPFGLHIAPFEASTDMMLLGPCFALYFGRRHTASKEDIHVATKTAANAVDSAAVDPTDNNGD